MLPLLRRGAADRRRRLASSSSSTSSPSQLFSSLSSSRSSSTDADSSPGLLAEPQAVVIALGGNVGDVPSAMASALEALPYRLGGRRGTDQPASFVVAASRLYASTPAYVVDQPPFRNAAAAVVTRLPPLALLRALKGIERDAGRGRESEGEKVRFGPRPLDLDVVFYSGLRGTFYEDERGRESDETDDGGDGVSAAVAQGLELPHPRWSERAFVMAPACDLVGGVEESYRNEEEERREKRESALELFGFLDDDGRRRRKRRRFSLRPPGASFPLPSRESAEGVAESLAEAAGEWRRLVRSSNPAPVSPEADCRLGGGGGDGRGSASGCWPVLPLPHGVGVAWRAQARAPRVMAVLNVTPDSFSDGGKLMKKRGGGGAGGGEAEEPDVEAVVAAARSAVSLGADLVDVGGQSTRPGARTVPAGVEARRVVPVVRALASDEFLMSRKVPISVDTFYASVAGECLRAGAHVVNDVTGGRGDEAGAMAGAVARAKGVLVLTHNRGGGSGSRKKGSEPPSFDPSGGSEDSDYGAYGGDVAVGVAVELAEAVEEAATATATSTTGGEPLPPPPSGPLPPPTLMMPWSMVLDPGLGFSKTREQNLSLLARTGDLRRALPPQYRTMPVLVGASRKGFLGDAVGAASTPSSSSAPCPLPHPRDAATVGSSAVAAAGGADLLRVHEVKANREAASVGAAARWGGDVGA